MARRRHSSRRHRHRGGAGAPNPSSYSSAAGYGMAVNGTTNQQYDRTFMGNGPANYTGLQGQMTGGRKVYGICRSFQANRYEFPVRQVHRFAKQ